MKKTVIILIVVCLICGGFLLALPRVLEALAPAEPSAPEARVTEPAAEQVQTSEETQSQAAQTEPVETVPVELPTTEPEPAGELFLTVSQITFSLAGDTEDIYAGSVPRDEVIWESGDESVITVDGGVLTAVAPGTTTVTASFEDQQLTCTAGCLAETPEELYGLSMDVLRSPKRIAPQVPDEILSYFEHTAMLGDSITYGFFKYEARNGRLGNPQCLCRGSLGIHNMLTHSLNLYYKGAEMHLEDVLADAAPEKVFILLGTNDVQVRSDETVISELDQLLDRVVEKSPDLEIYLQSVFPVVSTSPNGNTQNKRVISYNEALRAYAEEKGYHYVPVTPYLEDHIPGFAECYEQDQFHPSYEGVCAWIDALRAYARIEQLKGE